jgi:hypothetical protein
MEIILFRGFETQLLDEGKNLLASQGENMKEILFVPATKSMKKEKVEKLLNRIDNDEYTKEESIEGTKTVIMAVNSQERAIMLMRTFKSLLPNPQEAAFAMITETSLSWSLEYYMDHVTQEHEYMKTHNPENDPDMKKIT